MFWKRSKINKTQEDQIKKGNHNIIMNAIHELDRGNINYLHIVFSAFATSDQHLIGKAGKAIGIILEPLTESQMIKLDEQFRQYTSLE